MKRFGKDLKQEKLCILTKCNAEFYAPRKDTLDFKTGIRRFLE